MGDRKYLTAEEDTMDVETFCSAIAPILKASGFKKRRLNWRKDQGASIAVFNVQISDWGDRSYYLNAGVYLKALGAESAPPHNRCHVQERLKLESPESIVSKAIEWFAMRADALTKLHNGGRLLGKDLVFKEVINAIAV
jgi:Domain of unknown function (DUF4304)